MSIRNDELFAFHPVAVDADDSACAGGDEAFIDVTWSLS